MPPHVAASPKNKRAKRKGLDVSRPQPKNPQAAEPVKASGMPLVSLRLDATSTDEPARRSGRANAGTGGRNTQLEKIGTLLEAPSRVMPPPYSLSTSTNVPNTSHVDVSTAELLQSLNPSFRQPGGRFGKGNVKQAHKSVTGPSAANSVAPPTTFVDQNIDPDLWGINEVEHQSSEGSVSSDDNEEEEGEEEDEEEEMRFSGEDLPPSQPRVTRPITPEFDFQYSRNEDDMVAQTSVLHAANPSMLSVQRSSSSQPQLQGIQITISQPNNVLKRHHKKNGQLHLPDPEALELLHQVESDDDQPSKTKRSKKPSDGPKPTQLAWYVLVAWDQDGKQFEARIWPQQKSNMAQLLYDDLATWRSDLKKSAASLAPQSYSLIPPPSVSFQERAEWVEHAAAALLEGSLFLRFGLDEYYNCILDGLTKNGNGKYYPKFTARKYGPIYSKMVQMLDNILQDLYHGPRLLAQLREWTEAGWAASLRVDGAVETRHNHLQIILD
ncbi:uncharacterized protein HD556DRAFT_1307060 [Suillus plorans]|uniref:DUF6532 domain-containing protein n=1 Tax=Suillus plorans TaxID=116603 RepID=A0A9P7ATU9_9AGAM|nr:uncharacterized protein HD556DRAFT_1307060 [Suillus plorans]KAG1796318.1 hypothetical protein HD556DRAFT_1307060 [Suillus plorans]